MISKLTVFYAIDGNLSFGGNKNLGLALHRIKPCKWCVKCCKNGIRNTWFKKQYKSQDQHGKKANDNDQGAYFTLLSVSSGDHLLFQSTR